MLNDREKVFRSSGTSPSNGASRIIYCMMVDFRSTCSVASFERYGIQDMSFLRVQKEHCVMVDFCLTCSVANFESFGKECKSGVRIQDGCDLQSLPILPKQECILGHWFLCQVLRVVRERVSIQDWWCNLLSLPKQVCILGHWFLLQVFESYESVSVQDRWHLHLPKQECILGHWFLLQVLRVMRV